MTQIADDHTEWAVVDRLRTMLDKRPPSFNVTRTYALFTTILCWVMQRLRILQRDVSSQDDKIAHKVPEKLSGAAITDEPWRVHAGVTDHIELIGLRSVAVPAPIGFSAHTVDRFLINLRDATAHGDARNVLPFNVRVGSECVLAGFSFVCREFRERRLTWEGKITLLEFDMRRIGVQLAKIYCGALRRGEAHRRDNHFESDARSIEETAA